MFRNFRRSARRLETRDRYQDPDEDDALARFLAGSPDDPGYLASRDRGRTRSAYRTTTSADLIAKAIEALPE